jgi:hypothetical protein
MNRRPWIAILLFAAAAGALSAQVGVISVEPEAKADPHCQVYIGPEIVLTFSLDIHDQPFLNVINYTDQEVVVQADKMAFLLTDGRRVRPSLLKIATGIREDFILRAYFRIHPHGNFNFQLAGLEDCLDQIDRLEVELHPYRYRLDKVRRDFFDILIDRLEKVSLDETSVARAFRKLDIPMKGTRERKEASRTP